MLMKYLNIENLKKIRMYYQMGLFKKIFRKKDKMSDNDPIKEMEEYFKSAPQIAEDMINIYSNGTPEEIKKYEEDNHITKKDIENHHAEFKKMQEENDLFEKHYQRNQKALSLEKVDVNKAICLYELNVDEGCMIPETYNRLGSLYHDKGLFDDEIRVYTIAGNVIGYKQQSCNKEYYDNLIKNLKKMSK